MTLKHILAMDTISTLKDKKSYERFQNLLDEVIISAEKNRVLFIAWIGCDLGAAVAPADTSLPPAQAPTPIKKMRKQGLNQMILKILLHNVLQLCRQNSQVHLDE